MKLFFLKLWRKISWLLICELLPPSNQKLLLICIAEWLVICFCSISLKQSTNLFLHLLFHLSFHQLICLFFIEQEEGWMCLLGKKLIINERSEQATPTTFNQWKTKKKKSWFDEWGLPSSFLYCWLWAGGPSPRNHSIPKKLNFFSISAFLVWLFFAPAKRGQPIKESMKKRRVD